MIAGIRLIVHFIEVEKHGWDPLRKSIARVFIVVKMLADKTVLLQRHEQDTVAAIILAMFQYRALGHNKTPY